VVYDDLRTSWGAALISPVPIFTASLLVALSVSACGESTALPAPEVTVTDSSGIVVTTYGHTDAHLEIWSHDPEPVLELGSLGGDG